jgi:hypothetical protein
MPSEHLASGKTNLKGDLASAWNILEGASGNYTDLGIARRFGGAAAAYSLRDIGAMNGPVVTVRRDTGGGAGDDDEETFSAAQVASGAVEAFVGAGNDGFVTKLFDQSGNGNHATQTSPSNQPKIVSSGSLVTSPEGKPAIDMINGTITKFAMASEINMQSLFAVNSIPNVGGTAQVIVGKIDTNNKYVRYKGSGANFAPMANNASESAEAPNTPQLVFADTNHILEYNRDDSNDNTIFVSGTQATLSTNTVTSDIPINGIGVRQSTADPHAGKIQEIIMFEVDKSADREELRKDMASFYGITIA